MNDFQDFHDDLFYITYKVKKSSIHYDALKCEPQWFVSDNHQTCSRDLINIKFEADFKFLKGYYMEAIRLYDEYITKCPNINQPVKRECLEGIARSYLALYCYCYGLKYAKQLYDLSSTSDSYTCSLTLLYSAYKDLHCYDNLIITGQRLVNLHSSNSDVWLKLAVAYALYHDIALKFLLDLSSDFKRTTALDLCCQNISLPCVCVKESNKLNAHKATCKEKSVYKIFVCLLHCSFHLQSVKLTAVGFSRDINLNYEKLVNLEIEHLSLGYNRQNLMSHVKELYAGNLDDKDPLSINGRCTEGVSINYFNNKMENIISVLINDIWEKFEEKWLYFKKL